MSARYEVLITKAGQRDFRKLPPEMKDRVREAMAALGEAPQQGSQKLAGGDAFRRRVGDYRIVFRVDDDCREVLVARIKHRRDVYRR